MGKLRELNKNGENTLMIIKKKWEKYNIKEIEM